jgi:hypothetical protein
LNFFFSRFTTVVENVVTAVENVVAAVENVVTAVENNIVTAVENVVTTWNFIANSIQSAQWGGYIFRLKKNILISGTFKIHKAY